MNTLMVRSAHHKGFTLIELLIVIAIIAILATAVILLLNPTALLAQARDSQRISDLDTLKSAIALYQSTAGGSINGTGACYVYPAGDASVNCGGRHSTGAIGNNAGTRAVDGTGWVPVNFGGTPGGSPLSVLPIDPKNNTTYYYSYVGTVSGTFEIDANMESARYAACGGDDAETTDGGNKGTTTDCPGGASIATAVREVGNAPGLAL